MSLSDDAPKINVQLWPGKYSLSAATSFSAESALCAQSKTSGGSRRATSKRHGQVTPAKPAEMALALTDSAFAWRIAVMASAALSI